LIHGDVDIAADIRDRINDVTRADAKGGTSHVVACILGPRT
jgi:hypothetical protein